MAPIPESNLLILENTGTRLFQARSLLNPLLDHVFYERSRGIRSRPSLSGITISTRTRSTA